MKIIITYTSDDAKIGTAKIIPNKKRYRRDFHSMNETRFKATKVLVSNGFELLHGGWRWDSDMLQAYVWKRK